MTQDEKRICAEKLFDEIGLIDDRFITEAATPYVRVRGLRALRAVAIAAAAVTLAVTMALGAFVVGMIALGGKKDADSMNDETRYEEDMDNSLNSVSTLSEKLEGMRENTASLKTDRADIELFDGTPKIIWKYADEETYRVRSITEGELNVLTERLKENKGEKLQGDTDGGLEGLWISTGDGKVISPYLEQTAGNVGYGEIFEYEPEYEPAEDFSEYLCDVIS